MTIPPSTYRLQLHAGFPFGEALRVVDYLDDLGVGAVYTSPILRAATGSMHGYDLVDPSRVDPALGGEEAFAEWADELARRGLGRIVDFVPNHVGVATGENAWWNDVLQNGQCSLFADFFDIDWDPPKRALHGRVLLPILAKPYGEVLEHGELRVRHEGAAFFVDYGDHHLPLSPGSLPILLRDAIDSFTAADPNREARAAPEALREIADALDSLPSGADHDRRAARARSKDTLERRLARLLDEQPAAAEAVDAATRRLNGVVGDRSTFEALDALLQAQNYRLSDWRVAPDEINYRRFFDVSGLAAVRMEDPDVFAAMHGLVLRLAANGRIDGLRLDHTDGLREPAAYFAKLRRALGEACGTDAGLGLYVVAEKILERGEQLPRAWRIDGTTGYDFLGLVNGLWVDPSGERALSEIHRAQTGVTASYAATTWGAKRLVMRTILSSEIHALAQALEHLAGGRRRSRDFTLRVLTRGLVEILAALEVYRTYVRADGGRETADEASVRAATARAKKQNPGLESVLEFIEDMMLLRAREDVSVDQRAAQVSFGMRVQQLSGSVMAKGVEDTAFYRYSRLLSLNEVGSQPHAFGTSALEFHVANVQRRELWKGSMLTTSTHDTKRAEDARARLAVLSEMPEVWRARLGEWNVLAAPHLTTRGDASIPSAADRYYFYQAVVGGLPYGDLLRLSDDFIHRACDHMAKATKETKRETSWTRPDAAYDEAVQRFTSGMLRDPVFSACLRGFVHAIAAVGASNALGQAMLKLASPGVPDVYQGTEFWAFDFCDPDNRRPVDFALRRKCLADLRATPTTPSFAVDLLRRFEDGAIKMHVCRTLLHLRRAHPALFIDGSYIPIEAGERVIAFSRQGGGRHLVAVCARRISKLTSGTDRWAIGKVWGDARLPVAPGSYVDVLTGRTLVSSGEIALRDVLEVLPLAVLVA
jgi:(1->4)-alpha-D-glucan 1-alpha-D-glucosylmutase